MFFLRETLSKVTWSLTSATVNITKSSSVIYRWKANDVPKVIRHQSMSDDVIKNTKFSISSKYKILYTVGKQIIS